MSEPVISQIAAIGENYELGAKNALLWHLPDDFAWFVNHTRGHAMIMGRKTMESLGKPLKNRVNIVISRNPESVLEGFVHAPNLEAAIKLATETEQEEIFIIGGGEIYKQAMEITDKLYITRVYGEFPEADTFYPEWGDEWEETFHKHHRKDDKHDYAFDFLVLEKMDS